MSRRQLIKAGLFVIALALDIRWVTDFFDDGISWDNWWMFILIAAPFMVGFAFLGVLVGALKKQARREQSMPETGIGTLWPSERELAAPFYAGAILHYLITLAIYRDAPSCFLAAFHAMAYGAHRIMWYFKEPSTSQRPSTPASDPERGEAP